jgi:hypothetical protein
MRGISLLAGTLLASQEGLRSVEYVRIRLSRAGKGFLGGGGLPWAKVRFAALRSNQPALSLNIYEVLYWCCVAFNPNFTGLFHGKFRLLSS